MGKVLKSALCVAVLLGVCVACYRHPVLDYFDRLIYEAIVLGKSKPIDVAYDIVKHENQRSEASSILSSPQHLRELEPLYAIRPLYLETLRGLSFLMPLRRAIDLVSAASYFGIGIITMLWTRRPCLAVLLMAAYPLLVVARIGGPDALAALLAIAGLWLIAQTTRQSPGLVWLFVSLGVRTDNVLLLLAVLGWLLWKKQLSRVAAAVLALVAIATVLGIDQWAGNYGWIVLFQFSFVAKAISPLQVPHTLTLAEYFWALLGGTGAIAVHVALWILLGILAWVRGRDGVLVVIGLAAIMHFLLFPSPEDRYFVWAYIVVGITLIRSFDSPVTRLVRAGAAEHH